jgi:hypothetical protein
METDLISVEGDGPVDVADRHNDDLECPIHGRTLARYATAGRSVRPAAPTTTGADHDRRDSQDEADNDAHEKN